MIQNYNDNWLDDIGNDNYDDDLIVFTENEEQEQQWRMNRLGNLTCSTYGNLIVKDRQGGYKLSTSKTAENLIYKIAWERLLKSGNVSNGLGRLEINSKETNHGSEWEDTARIKYQEITGNKVISENKYYAFDDWIGGTPDGFVEEDGIIEIKCPYNGGNHLKTMLTGEIYNEDYIYQIQGYLWITGRKWCDFITYDPDLIEELQINIIRVERDEHLIEAIKMIMEEIKVKINNILSSEKLKIS